MKHALSHNLSLTSLLLGMVVLEVWMSPLSALASEITPERVIELVNADRTQSGLMALEKNDQLAQAAQAKAQDMAEKDYFAHTSPEGKTPWYWIEQSGYDYRYAGENLAIRYDSAEEQEQAWLASPTHRANILSDRFMEIGVAVLSVEQNGRPVTLVVQEFGTRSGVNVPAPVVTRVSHLTQQALEAPAIQGQAVWSGVIRQTDMFQRAFLIGWALVEIGAVMAFWFWKYARPHRQKALA